MDNQTAPHRVLQVAEWTRSIRVPLLIAAMAIVAACAPAQPSPSAPLAASAPPAVVAVIPKPSSTLEANGVAESPSPTAPGPVFSFDPNASPDPGPTIGLDSDYAPLDGMPAKADVRTRLPVAVTIDDNVQARPQYGFNSASIVYQAPADGGETRYMMVFQEKDAKRIEPVRSGRPYFVNWASEYRSAFAHYGGDLKTLTYLPKLDGKVLYDVDAIYGSGSAFRRDNARKAPHNGVTSSTAVRKKAISHGAPKDIPADVGVRPFADDLSADERPAKGSIRVPYNRGDTSYTYDKAHNRYLRSVAGKAQIDAADRKRVTARNVVVLYMRHSIDPESEPHHNRPVFDHVGSGKGLVFRDGHVIKATWKKPSAHALTRLYDEAGKEISLVRGPIFIQVVKTGTRVTYDAKTLP